MKSLVSRVMLAVAALLAVWVMLTGATPAKTSTREPDKLIILSTVDAKGKTSPCG